METMNGSDSPINIDEMIERKKRELVAELQLAHKLAAKYNMKLVPIVDEAQRTTALPTTNTKPTKPSGFDGTVKSLVECYRADKRSPYHQLKFAVRKNYEF